MKTVKKPVVIMILTAAVVAGLAGCGGGGTIDLNVSCAGSLTDAIKEVNRLYSETNPDVNILANFAASGTLQTQIENGAPADVFISAAARQMDLLEGKGLILNDTRRDLLNNSVVLVVPQNSHSELDAFEDLTGDNIGQIAMGDPEFVPAGTYGKQAFELLGIYQQIQHKLILGSDVRQVLSYVESGNVDAGIVFATDAAISARVKIMAEGPEEINSGIVYPVAVIKTSHKANTAGEYIQFLFSQQAREVFEKYGFKVING